MKLFKLLSPKTGSPGAQGFKMALLACVFFTQLGLVMMGSDFLKYARQEPLAMQQGKGLLLMVMIYSGFLAGILGAFQFLMAQPPSNKGFLFQALSGFAFFCALAVLMVFGSYLATIPAFVIARAL